MRRPLAVVLALCCLLSPGVAAAALPAGSGGSAPAASAPPDDPRPVPAAERNLAPGPGLRVDAGSQTEDCPDAPGIVCVPNTTNHLAPDRSNVVRTSFNDSSIDVSAALSADSAAETSIEESLKEVRTTFDRSGARWLVVFGTQTMPGASGQSSVCDPASTRRPGPGARFRSAAGTGRGSSGGALAAGAEPPEPAGSAAAATPGESRQHSARTTARGRRIVERDTGGELKVRPLGGLPPDRPA